MILKDDYVKCVVTAQYGTDGNKNMITLSPEKQAELLAEYHRKKEALQAEQNRQAEAQKQETMYWATKKANLQTCKIRKPRPCGVCGKTKPAGSVMAKRTVIVNVARNGYTGAFQTEYICEECRKVKGE
jgi:hypothetical protein